jgi:hypothetical protein
MIFSVSKHLVGHLPRQLPSVVQIGFASLPLTVAAQARRFRRIDLHPAYGIVQISLLHGSIVDLFAQLDV